LSKAIDRRDVLKSPVITEKSITATANSMYTFKCHPEATKTQIRDAVESLFKVKVRRINTVTMNGKVKTFARRGARTEGKRSDWKKAVVVLDPGQTITLGGVNYFEQ
jgi:large subunit ribosomal protein L23